MPEGYNWLDVTIAIVLLLCLIQGVRVGLIRNIVTIIGLAAGLTAAFMYYARVSSFVLEFVPIPQFTSDFFAFTLIFSMVSLVIHYLGSFFTLITRFSLVRLVDKIGGIAAGFVIGLAVVGIILVLLSAFPVYADFEEHVEESLLAPPIIDSTNQLYDELSALLPFKLPNIAAYPEELSNYFSRIDINGDHPSIDFKSLDGTACFVCGSPVEYLGFLTNNNGSVSPKFVCTGCGRTSDGCQTYEGYHQMYEKCPVEMGNRGYRLDCGIWTNNSYHRPTGLCPVCGTQ